MQYKTRGAVINPTRTSVISKSERKFSLQQLIFTEQNTIQNSNSDPNSKLNPNLTL